MSISLFEVAVYAENIDLSNSDYTIIDSGEYNIIGNGLETTHKIIIDDNAAEVTLTITDLNINAADGPAIKIGNGSSLNLILNGENYLKGSQGYAAISVSAFFNGNVYDPEGSGKIVISGKGSLEAIGGDAKENCGAGAGIGGDGFNGKSGSDFGVIHLIEGEIKAHGGTAFGEMDVQSTAGAGAGIGSGGVTGTDDCISAGKIVIDGAKVESIGGKGYGIYYCGAAAGIGAGGGDSNGQAIYATDISIEIKSGTVEAKACEDFDSYYGAAAGIGGASNSANGEIIISGGTVYAYGGNSPDCFSGAAIGSGDNAGGYKITIKGDAIVYAYAKDGGAAIGGGYYGFGDIEIFDSASVYAYGGQYAAGIGSGFSPRYGNDSNVSNITLDSTGAIIAYGANYIEFKYF